MIAIDPATLPELPGVYFFVGKSNEILYIGKADNIRSRVRQYLAGHDNRPLIPHLLREMESVRFIVVQDAREALLLENSLIKKHQPRYNLDLKDDKSYPYLALSDGSYPSLTIVRRPRGQFRYLRGPFPSAKLLRVFREALLAVYPLRRCRTMGRKACVNHQMGLCPAPCEGRISSDAYESCVAEIVSLLEGRTWQRFEKRLYEMLSHAVTNLRFEKAAQYRDLLRILPEVRRRLGITSRTKGVLDAFYLSHDGKTLFMTVGRYEGGNLLDIYHLHQPLTEEPAAAAPRAIASFYDFQTPPETLSLFPETLADPALVTALLDPPPRTVPMEPPVRTILARNQSHHRRQIEQARGGDETALDDLEQIVGREVTRILCLDVSTLQGAHTRAGAVWWEAGSFVTRNYRLFTMKSARGHDDFAALAETAARLCAHWDAGEWPIPDLLLVDGGILQLNAVLSVVGDRVTLLGIVKDRRSKHGCEKLVTSDGGEMPLGNDSCGLLLKRIRDEAHRFVVTAHRRARRRDISSLFADIPGIGRAREKSLLAHFGTFAAIQSATPEELAAVPGMTSRVAEALWRRLHESDAQKG